MIARVTLPSGRTVLETRTGLRIGLLATEYRPPEPGEHARMWQRLFTTPMPRLWFETPRVIRLRRSWWQRLRDWWMEGGKR
jgi:hypothetical protein